MIAKITKIPHLPPKTEDAVKTIDALIALIEKERDYLVSREDIEAWEKIKYDLRRLQEIDKRHDGTW